MNKNYSFYFKSERKIAILFGYQIPLYKIATFLLFSK